MQALLDQWMAIRNQPITGSPGGGSIQKRIYKELGILKALLNSGCLTIPGESASVRSLIQQREQSLRAAVERFTRRLGPR
jgi:hypothetical protein